MSGVKVTLGGLRWRRLIHIAALIWIIKGVVDVETDQHGGLPWWLTLSVGVAAELEYVREADRAMVSLIRELASIVRMLANTLKTED